MQFIYEVFREIRNPVPERCGIVTTKLDDIEEAHVTHPYFVEVLNGLTGQKTYLMNVEELDAWRSQMDHAQSMQNEADGFRSIEGANKELQLIQSERKPFNFFEETDGFALKHSVPTETPNVIHKHVDPSHYKNYVGDLQWIDAMRQIPTLKEHFEVALELQVRKYLDRRGQKDEQIQELKKARVYLQYMIEYLEGKEPMMANVQNKLKTLEG